MKALSSMQARGTALKIFGAIGAIIGYGCLAAFLYLVGTQVYRWFREGEWPHFAMEDGMRAGLLRCCVKEGDSGHVAALMQWLDTPVDWLGLHKVIEWVPASLALFAVSIMGNWLFLYCRDRLANR